MQGKQDSGCWAHLAHGLREVGLSLAVPKQPSRKARSSAHGTRRPLFLPPRRPLLFIADKTKETGVNNITTVPIT